MASVPAGVIAIWTGTNASIPSGWARVTSLDDKFIKGTAVSVDPDVTGGATTHLHSTAVHTHAQPAHTHTATTPGTDGSPTTVSSSGYNFSIQNHTHTATSGSVAGPTSGNATPAWGSPSSNPLFYRVIYVEAAGANGFADDLCCFYDSGTDPTNWAQHSGSEGRFLFGMSAGGDGGGTGGSSTHTHTTSAHTHSIGNHDHGVSTSGGPSAGTSGGPGIHSAPPSTHTHDVTYTNDGSGTSGGLSGGVSSGTSNDPPYHKLNLIQNTSGGSLWLEDGIFMWLGLLSAIPVGWRLCDGTLSTPDLRDKFILTDAAGGGDHGGTGGNAGHNHTTAGHTHTAAHTHSSLSAGSDSGSVNESRNPVTLISVWGPHGHPGSFSSNSTDPGLNTTSPTLNNNSDTQPAFRTVAYIMAPAEPVESAIFFGGNF